MISHALELPYVPIWVGYNGVYDYTRKTKYTFISTSHTNYTRSGEFFKYKQEKNLVTYNLFIHLGSLYVMNKLYLLIIVLISLHFHKN